LDSNEITARGGGSISTESLARHHCCMKRWIHLWVLVAALSVFLEGSRACCQKNSATTFTLPSGLPSGDVVNDQIWVTFFPAKGAPFRAPAVVLVHPLGEVRNRIMDVFGRYLAGAGLVLAGDSAGTPAESYRSFSL